VRERSNQSLDRNLGPSADNAEGQVSHAMCGAQRASRHTRDSCGVARESLTRGGRHRTVADAEMRAFHRQKGGRPSIQDRRLPVVTGLEVAIAVDWERKFRTDAIKDMTCLHFGRLTPLGFRSDGIGSRIGRGGRCRTNRRSGRSRWRTVEGLPCIGDVDCAYAVAKGSIAAPPRTE
jgi:hypothetical protein